MIHYQEPPGSHNGIGQDIYHRDPLMETTRIHYMNSQKSTTRIIHCLDPPGSPTEIYQDPPSGPTMLSNKEPPGSIM